MFTVCPKCALTLVVTAADLRVAQGYVRCGRCLNVFNALARLSEERPAPPAAPPDTTAAQAPEPPAAPPQPTASSAQTEDISDDTGEIDVELDARLIMTSTRIPAPARTMEEAVEAEEEVQEAKVESEAQPAAAASSEPLEIPSGEQAAPQAQTEPEPEQRTEISSPPAEPDAEQANSAQQSPESAFEPEARRPRAGLAWTLGAGALALALALQIINHDRDALAANPALRGPLSAVYSALGVKLAPRWDLHAFDVRQLGASVAGTAAGEIVVRASVKNSASRAQPLPLLRVTLQDRFGNRIAARDVPPADYLPAPVAPGSLLAAGSRVDATMVFVDPGPQAVGFEIDACLPRSNGGVDCAHGP